MTIINRVWAMPNSQTFTIKPIKELIERHIADKEIIIDPFARDSKYGTITNDLNPEYDTTHHMDAMEIIRKKVYEVQVAYEEKNDAE